MATVLPIASGGSHVGGTPVWRIQGPLSRAGNSACPGSHPARSQRRSGWQRSVDGAFHGVLFIVHLCR